MKKTHVAVIGAQGHFGSALCTRMKETTSNAIVSPTRDKSSNRKMAAEADVVLLTVRPDQAENVLKEIRDVLQPEALVVSFAARYPLTSVIEITERAGARIMADLFWNMSAFVVSDKFPPETFEGLFGNLTKTNPIQLADDKVMDAYTILLVHVLVVVLLERLERIDNAEEHLQFLSRELSELGGTLSIENFRNFDLGTDPEESLKLLATPGGITEKVLRLLEETKKPEDVRKLVGE